MTSPRSSFRAVHSLAAALLCCCLVMLLCLPFSTVAFSEGSSRTSPATTPQTEAPRRAGEILIRFRNGVSQREKDMLLATHGARRKSLLRGESGVEKLELTGGQDVLTAVLQLRLNPQVEFAEPNFLISKDDVVPDDPDFAQQWALRNTGQDSGQFGSDINVSPTWKITTGFIVNDCCCNRQRHRFHSSGAGEQSVDQRDARP